MSVDSKIHDLASQENISGSPANLSSTSMLSGTVAKSVPNENSAGTVIDQNVGCGLASSDVMYVTTKKFYEQETLFLCEVESKRGLASSILAFTVEGVSQSFFTLTSEIRSITETISKIGNHDNLF